MAKSGFLQNAVYLSWLYCHLFARATFPEERVHSLPFLAITNLRRKNIAGIFLPQTVAIHIYIR